MRQQTNQTTKNTSRYAKEFILYLPCTAEHGFALNCGQYTQ